MKEKDPYRFYVYLHRRADNNEVFYVGKGSGDRIKVKNRRSKWWQNIVAKYGYRYEYVEKGLSEEDAFDLEVELIKFYKENGYNICNIKSGGEGKAGHIYTEDRIAKLKEYLNSEEFRSNMRKKIGKEVICSNGMIFETCKEAEKWLGNSPSSSKVSTNCRRESNSAGGFVWRFMSDCDDLMECINNGKDAFVEFKCKEYLDKSIPKKVYCSNGMVFDSGGAATRWYHSIGFTKVIPSYISACCNGRKKTLHGLSWSFEDIFKTKNQVGIS